MTLLTKTVSRETAKRIQSRNVIVSLSPCGAQEEARVGFRLKGKRTQYVLALSDLYRWAAEQYGNKERAAKRAARKSGVAWRYAKRAFIRENSIQ